MDPVIIIFVMATGFVALTAILPILFWFIHEGSTGFPTPTSRQALQNPDFQVKPPPTGRTRQFAQPYSARTASENFERGIYQVKPLPATRPPRVPMKRWAAAS